VILSQIGDLIRFFAVKPIAKKYFKDLGRWKKIFGGGGGGLFFMLHPYATALF